MTGLVDWAAGRARMVFAFIVLSIAVGIYAYAALPKEGEPDIEIPALFVAVPFPGISAADAEKLILKPLESEVQDIDGLDRMTGFGAEGFAQLVLEFEFGWNKGQTLADVRDAVDKAKAQFPQGYEEPTIDEINFSEFPILIVALSGDLPERTLLRVAKELQDRIESLPPILEAPLAGDREEMVEVVIDSLEILSESAPLPFPIDEHAEVGEETRLKYRYLDLRRQEPARILRMRSQVNKLARDVLDEQGFVEVETPTLTRSTPEGARDFLVPVRLQPGMWYALPQSPQLFKQLLMVAGMERYYQIARCYRDEDFRADRQPEFTQLDIEMSFVDASDVMAEVRLAGAGHGFDVTSGQVVDVMQAGIYDPAIVLKSAVYAALTTASMALTVDVLIHRTEQPKHASIRVPSKRKQL